MSELQNTGQGNKSAQAPCSLLPCSFCGGKAIEAKYWKLPGVERYKAICSDCGISIEDGCTAAEILLRWNSRCAVWFDIEEFKPELNTWCFVSDGSGSHFAAYMDGLGFLGADGEASQGK